MTNTREENARDLQREALQKDAKENLADSDCFECVECQCVLDIEESVSANGELICELCEEQSKANGSTSGTEAETESLPMFFGCSFTPESFNYLNEDREDQAITPEQIAKGLENAAEAFRINHYQLKEQFFEFALDLCEACIWDEAETENGFEAS